MYLHYHKEIVTAQPLLAMAAGLVVTEFARFINTLQLQIMNKSFLFMTIGPYKSKRNWTAAHQIWSTFYNALNIRSNIVEVLSTLRADGLNTRQI